MRIGRRIWVCWFWHVAFGLWLESGKLTVDGLIFRIVIDFRPLAKIKAEEVKVDYFLAEQALADKAEALDDYTLVMQFLNECTGDLPVNGWASALADEMCNRVCKDWSK